MQIEHRLAVLSGDGAFPGLIRKQHKNVGAGDRPAPRENRDDGTSVRRTRRAQHPPGNQPRFRTLLKLVAPIGHHEVAGS